MADEVDSKSSEGSTSRLVVPLALLTTLAAAGGGFLGWFLSASEARAPIVKPATDAPNGAEAPPEKDAPAVAKRVDPDAGLALKELTPIVTNLSGSGRYLVRLQAAILYDPKGLAHPEKLLAELASDTVAYLRTVELAEIEGVGGLRRLHEDLSERFSLRSEGRVRQLIIESLVVQ